MNLARTPIADYLAAVAGDLQDATGQALVVLVTDGEETRDGDPAQAIEQLKARGFDVNLNVVGVAIDDIDLEALFETWAELGDGSYYSAKYAAGLSDAIDRAVAVAFRVYDPAGDLVAQGQIDGPMVELTPGAYCLVAETSPRAEFEIEIAGEQTLSLELE